MKRSEMNPFFKIYHGTICDSINLCKPQKGVSVYQAVGKDLMEKGEKIVEFNFEPILDYVDYCELFEHYDDYKLFDKFYSHISHVYFYLTIECYKWFSGITQIRGALDINAQLKSFEAKELNDFSCPIIKHLNIRTINNVSFRDNFIAVINSGDIEGIETIDELLYGIKNPDILKRPEYTLLAERLMNSVVNIVYLRFHKFLLGQFTNKDSQSKKPLLNGAVVSLFCSILHQSQIIIKGDEESPEKFIARIAERFQIDGVNPAKARQYFNTTMDLKKNDKNLKKVFEFILPKIESGTEKKVLNYLQSKKLYT